MRLASGSAESVDAPTPPSPAANAHCGSRQKPRVSTVTTCPLNSGCRVALPTASWPKAMSRRRQPRSLAQFDEIFSAGVWSIHGTVALGKRVASSPSKPLKPATPIDTGSAGTPHSSRRSARRAGAVCRWRGTVTKKPATASTSFPPCMRFAMFHSYAAV